MSRTAGDAAHRIHVDLGPRSYDILIDTDLLERAGAVLAPFLVRPQTVIVTDSNVAQYHLGTLQDGLSANGIRSEVVVIPAGEHSKSWVQLGELLEQLLALQVERRDCIIALGGGVVGDLTGFAAAILRRGTGVIQIPTTLLAQVDSSVGGKTAIDSPQGKNLIGAFHQPQLVLCDVASLASLPRRDCLAGYAEVVKYGLLGAPDFFGWLEQNGAALIDGEADAVTYAVAESCRQKARIVEADERESGLRALLNLGHTFGHALETLAGHDSDKLLHGEAVAIGCIMAFELSEKLGYCSQEDVKRIQAHFQAVGLPTHPYDVRMNDFHPNAMLAAMKQDKKVKAGQVTLVLARKIGAAFVTDAVADADIVTYLASCRSGRPL